MKYEFDLSVGIDDVLKADTDGAIVTLMNMIERELNELDVVAAARIRFMVKHVKWAVRDGENIDLDAIRKKLDELDSIPNSELSPGKPDICADNVERGGHSCGECDHLLHCFPECDPDNNNNKKEVKL